MTDIDRIFPTRLNFPVAGATMKVEVDATHPGWGHSNASSWCPVKQYSNYVTATASKNTTKELRRTSMAIISGDDMDDTEDISIYQSCEFNAENLILLQKQVDADGCGATCAAMCVCQTQSQFVKDNIPIDFGAWSTVADTYGYTWTGYYNMTLKEVYNILKEGVPIILLVNNGNNGQKPHYVTVYRYTGTSTNGNNLDPADFMCADPYYGDTRKLNTSMNFNKNNYLSQATVFKQKVC